MKRRVVLITCLLGIIGGSAGVSLASTLETHDVCVSVAQNENYHGARYVCLDAP